MSKQLFFMPSRIKSDVGGVPIENKSKPLSLGSLVDAEPCSVACANLDKRSVAVPVALQQAGERVVGPRFPATCHHVVL